ncbi:hypothetical protein [Neisseria wadsworthii]|uniref:Uncharacterized protein n=1 Tax=Neisseria wadsworthii 9715 TaxID=1030841 RepID=G4CSQ6_9NEIS|nr:hypothetical protein [Neisseria wadsworthii]EGZ44612.1 hypothetical protein HMPREF9370_2138 [Neisseria wadsworthii 9715]QMT35752.1 hypothetical protein H3L96_00260 [Neisseria wadsworthii]
MSNTKSGFKLTPRKLLFIALAIVALIVFALVGYTFSVVTTKEQIKRTDQTGTSANQPQVELLSPNGGKGTVVTVQSASQASAIQSPKDDNSKDKTATEEDKNDNDEDQAEEPHDHTPAAPRATAKPQTPKRNSEPAAENTNRNAQRETPVEPIRRSREPAPTQAEQAPRSQSNRSERPAPAPAPQREVMDNLF